MHAHTHVRAHTHTHTHTHTYTHMHTYTYTIATYNNFKLILYYNLLNIVRIHPAHTIVKRTI